MTDSSPASAPPAAGEPARPGCAVLCSAGLDSAVLLAHQAQITNGATARSLPVYVRVGLAWEDAERATLAGLLASPIFAPAVAPLVVLDLDMRDVYPRRTGRSAARRPPTIPRTKTSTSSAATSCC